MAGPKPWQAGPLAGTNKQTTRNNSMNKIVKNRFEMFVGVKLFSGRTGLPANARATALFADNQTVITNLTTASAAQEEGRGLYSGAAADRLRIATELRELVRKASGIAKVLDPAAFPDLRQQVRGPISSSYQALIASALAIKNVVTPAATKAAFVDRGLAADFDVELDDLATSLQEATARKGVGRGKLVGGTTGLLAESRRGVAIVRELDAIMDVILANNPGLLAEWKSVSHVQRPPQREPEGAGSGTGSDPGGSGSTANTTTGN
jgi:hypothetical protein